MKKRDIVAIIADSLEDLIIEIREWEDRDYCDVSEETIRTLKIIDKDGNERLYKTKEVKKS